MNFVKDWLQKFVPAVSDTSKQFVPNKMLVEAEVIWQQK